MLPFLPLIPLILGAITLAWVIGYRKGYHNAIEDVRKIARRTIE
jgi:hypothetical protein